MENLFKIFLVLTGIAIGLIFTYAIKEAYDFKKEGPSGYESVEFQVNLDAVEIGECPAYYIDDGYVRTFFSYDKEFCQNIETRREKVEEEARQYRADFINWCSFVATGLSFEDYQKCEEFKLITE